jgi:hypothetical protein
VDVPREAGGVGANLVASIEAGREHNLLRQATFADDVSNERLEIGVKMALSGSSSSLVSANR